MEAGNDRILLGGCGVPPISDEVLRGSMGGLRSEKSFRSIRMCRSRRDMSRFMTVFTWPPEHMKFPPALEFNRLDFSDQKMM
ncbi:hypothetical protein RRG08_036590 [Elysia crispata]|uniref:Uncharacterized protein n=1 Tax=Elysia crispata TaxID=231223 RepID=A0AAE0ZQU7_9GAST|nr:hypothetical protein RRG08_036590 [Elysia crispata]